MFAAINADPQTQNDHRPLASDGELQQITVLSPISFDVAAMHSYPSAREPTFNLDTFIGQWPRFAARRPSRSCPPKPATTTTPAVRLDPGNSSRPSTCRAYIAEYFNRGIDRTYIYEFANQGPDTTDREQNFGLLHFDLTEKPAFTAMKNLIDLVEEPNAAAFTPGSLDYTLTSSASLSALHHTLLQKSDGKFYLMLWQEVRVYNASTNSDIIDAPRHNPPPQHRITHARLFLPNNSSNPTSTFDSPTTINLSIPDQMLVIELTPSAIPEPTSASLLAITLLLATMRRTRPSRT